MEQETNGKHTSDKTTISTPYITLIVAVIAIVVAFYVFCIAETKCCFNCRKKLCFSNEEQKSSKGEPGTKRKNANKIDNTKNENLHSKLDSKFV